MDEDEDLFRPPWEEDDGPRPSGRRAARADTPSRPNTGPFFSEAPSAGAVRGGRLPRSPEARPCIRTTWRCATPISPAGTRSPC